MRTASLPLHLLRNPLSRVAPLASAMLLAFAMPLPAWAAMDFGSLIAPGFEVVPYPAAAACCGPSCGDAQAAGTPACAHCAGHAEAATTPAGDDHCAPAADGAAAEPEPGAGAPGGCPSLCRIQEAPRTPPTTPQGMAPTPPAPRAVFAGGSAESDPVQSEEPYPLTPDYPRFRSLETPDHPPESFSGN